MRRALGRAAAVTLLAALAAACSKESDGNVLSSRDNNAPLGGKEQEYAEAISTSAQRDDPDDDNEVPFSPEVADCWGQAFVEVLGVDRLETEITPDETVELPLSGAADWGVALSDEEGLLVFRSLVACDPGVVRELGTSLSEWTLDLNAPVEVDSDCLGAIDPADIEGAMGAAIAEDDESVPAPDDAATVVDWIMGCADLRGAVIESVASEFDPPDAMAACLDRNLTEDVLRDLMIATVTSYEDIENTPAVDAYAEVLSGCDAQVAGGG